MYKLFGVIGAIVFPVLVSAQFFQTTDIILGASNIVRLLIGLGSAIAVLVFIWGLVKYIAAQSNEGVKAEAKKVMIGGVIALFVLFSIWGLIFFIQTQFLIGPNVQPFIPPSVTFPGADGGQQ